MTFTYTRLISRFAATVLKKHTRKFSHVLSVLKHSPPAGKLCSRYFSESPDDFYANIEDDDFGSHEKMSNYSEVDFESIAQGDPEKMKILKRIQLEIDLFAQEGGNVPKEISSTNWMELSFLPSKSRRLKHISFLYANEQRKLIKKRKQELFNNELEMFKMVKEPRLPLSTSAPVEYGLLKTTLFHRFYDSDMKKFYNYRLLHASMFGPHLIIDCGFDDYMSQLEVSHCVKDMLRSWSENREYFYPYDIIFCNMHEDSKLFSRLSGLLPTMKTDPTFPFNFTDKHYLDLFPKEQLVYLTPHSKEEMSTFDGNSIYIIGGLWDKSKDFAVTMAKAKKEGIRKVKFPLDKYMKWNFGQKTLSITQCVAIMNDLKDGKDWDFALRRLKKEQQIPRSNLLDDGRVRKTSRKNPEYIEEYGRQKQVYDMLLTKSSMIKK